MIRCVAFALAALAIEACPPSPAPPVPDAGPSLDAAPPPPVDAGLTVYARACSNLVARGCSEGLAANCAAVMEHAQTSHLVTMDADCIARARSKTEVRTCGPVACP